MPTVKPPDHNNKVAQQILSRFPGPVSFRISGWRMQAFVMTATTTFGVAIIPMMLHFPAWLWTSISLAAVVFWVFNIATYERSFTLLPDGFAMKNILRTKVIFWRDIERFEIIPTVWLDSRAGKLPCAYYRMLGGSKEIVLGFWFRSEAIEGRRIVAVDLCEVMAAWRNRAIQTKPPESAPMTKLRTSPIATRSAM